jgi:hypothetical protein
MQPWPFTTCLDLLERWQTLVAGLVALLAAWITVRESKRLERRKEQRENDAIRASLAVEIRKYVNDMLERHKNLTRLAKPGMRIAPSDLTKSVKLSRSIVYPAMADRIGLLGPLLAAGVSEFYANIARINLTAKIVGNATEPLSPPDYSGLVGLLEQACQRSLPLLEALPIDEIADVKAKIEGMAKPDRADATS